MLVGSLFLMVSRLGLTLSQWLICLNSHERLAILGNDKHVALGNQFRDSREPPSRLAHWEYGDHFAAPG